MVVEGLHDGQTYKDMHDVILRIKAEMLTTTTYMITIWRRWLRQGRAP